jgi:RimJ/RimL family protein N-acetyltransferase
VRLDDAAFIVALRTDPARNQFINVTVPDVSKQEEWLRAYFERRWDYYFVIEHCKTGEREGTLGVYDVDEQQQTAEWGRWIVRRGSKAAGPSGCLVFDLAFGDLGLSALHSYVAAEHTAVLDLLSALGMRQMAKLPARLSIAGVQHDAVKLRITRTDWEAWQ